MILDPERLEQLQIPLTVVGGSGVTAWLATANTVLATITGILTIAVLVRTLVRSRKK